MKSRRIRTKLDTDMIPTQLGGWLDGSRTYIGIWSGKDGKGECLGHLGGGKLYRLAKAIVRQWEASKEKGK